MAESKDIIIPYEPRHEGVHEALEGHRFSVLVAHRRFGKTVLVVNHLLKWALLCAEPRGSFAYVGPFRNQAKSVAWDYLKHYSAVIPGRQVNESELCISVPSNGGGSRIRIFGADNPDALRGLYFDGVVLDEVADMKPSLWSEVVRPALVDRRGWAVFIGTPKGANLFSDVYYRAAGAQARGDADWCALSFPVTATNVLPEGEVERWRAELSENAFRQEMLCDFSASSDDALITLDEVRAAIGRGADPGAAAVWPLVMGVDVARFGDDATVFFRRRGREAYAPEVMRGLSNVEVAHRLMADMAEHRPAYVCIDQGQGTGVIDLVRELTRHQPVSVVEVPFGGRAMDAERFANRRAEMWVALRDWLREGGRLPDDRRWGGALEAELTAPTYFFNAAGKLQLEDKASVKARLSRSTDLADALALTFAVPVRPDERQWRRPFERYGREGSRAAMRHIMGVSEGYDLFGERGHGRDVWD